MRAQLAVGTMNFGRRTDAAEAQRIVDAALDAGLSTFDTANLYGDGDAERVLGQALGARRGRAQVWTKVGAWKGEGLSQARVVASLDESLGRLGCDAVDVYLLHAPDERTPLEDTLDGVARVLAAGKAKAWGVSNHASWQVLELRQLAQARGLPPPAQSQVLYNVAVRQLEVEYFRFARRFGVRTAVYNPLAGGLLARAPSDPPPARARLVANGLYRKRYGSPALAAYARTLAALAAEEGRSLLELAYAWVAQRPGVDVVLAGPATHAHLLDAVRAVELVVSPALLARVDDAHRAFTGTDASYAR